MEGEAAEKGGTLPERGGDTAIDLHSCQNDACKTCESEQRKEKTEDSLCTEVASAVDDMPVRCVGKWAYDKIYRLVQYFGIFTQGMKAKWEGKLNYIEICRGPGRCVMWETGEEIDGTALAIVQHSNFRMLQSATFIDFNTKVVDTLNRRLARIAQSRPVKAVEGDFKDIDGLRTILRSVHRGLNLVFIDPTECDVPFEAVQCIKETLSDADFIINVAIRTDFNRNVVSAATDSRFHKARRKYEVFLGDDTFFKRPDIIEKANLNKHDELRSLFRERYKEKLAQIGLPHTDERSVENFYSLIFASAHERGLEFWKKANTYEPNRQKTFGF